MRGEEIISQGKRRDSFFQNLADGKEVAETLRHLLGFNIKKTRVEPISNKGFLVGDRFHLRDFGFMMRKNKVDGPTVDIILRTEFGLGDGRVFDMPTRPSLAEIRLPDRFSLFLKFPKAEVTRIFLVRIFIYAGDGIACLKGVSTRKFTVILELFRVKVISIRNFV